MEMNNIKLLQVPVKPGFHCGGVEEESEIEDTMKRDYGNAVRPDPVRILLVKIKISRNNGNFMAPFREFF